MSRIRVQIGVDDPIEIACATKTEALERAERLVTMFRRAGSGRSPLPVRGSAKAGKWTVEGLHDPIKVTVA